MGVRRRRGALDGHPDSSTRGKDSPLSPQPSARGANEHHEQLTRSAGVVSLAVLASRVLGLVREIALAHLFETRLGLDAYSAAFRIPNMLRDLFGEGALSKAFVSTFTDVDHRDGERAAWRLASRVNNLLFVILGVVCLLGMVFAPQLVAAMLPGEGFDTPLPADQAFGFATKRELTVYLTRLMLPFLPLVSLAAVAMGVLNTRERFGIPALSSAFFNVGSMTVGLIGYFVGPSMGFHPVAGMAVGVLFGGLLQWIVQVPQMRSVGYRWTPQISVTDPDVRQIGRLIGPALLGIAAVQINVFVNSIYASFGAGWVSWTNVSFRLMYLPIGVFGVAVSTANLPALARATAAGDSARFRETLSHSLRLILLLTIPSSVGLALLSRPIIRLIYEHGAFTARDSEMAGAALFYYAIGLCGYSAVKIVTDAFYALKDTKTPLKVSLGAVGLNLVLGYLFVFVLGWDHRGLALATSISVTLNFVVLLAFLRAELGSIDGRANGALVLKAGVASAVMGVAVLSVENALEAWLGVESILARLVEVAASIGAGIAVFVVVGWLLKLRELGETLGLLPPRFRR
jgi:putative peptidoglycan lipid II flippase